MHRHVLLEDAHCVAADCQRKRLKEQLLELAEDCDAPPAVRLNAAGGGITGGGCTSQGEGIPYCDGIHGVSVADFEACLYPVASWAPAAVASSSQMTSVSELIEITKEELVHSPRPVARSHVNSPLREGSEHHSYNELPVMYGSGSGSLATMLTMNQSINLHSSSALAHRRSCTLGHGGGEPLTAALPSVRVRQCCAFCCSCYQFDGLCTGDKARGLQVETDGHDYKNKKMENGKWRLPLLEERGQCMLRSLRLQLLQPGMFNASYPPVRKLHLSQKEVCKSSQVGREAFRSAPVASVNCLLSEEHKPPKVSHSCKKKCSQCNHCSTYTAGPSVSRRHQLCTCQLNGFSSYKSLLRNRYSASQISQARSCFADGIMTPSSSRMRRSRNGNNHGHDSGEHAGMKQQSIGGRATQSALQHRCLHGTSSGSALRPLPSHCSDKCASLSAPLPLDTLGDNSSLDSSFLALGVSPSGRCQLCDPSLDMMMESSTSIASSTHMALNNKQ
ncbi:hypothetical protein TRVL_05032 [Trypanosoma vivax]|nr:hypothetical protein TRVL_05032 [Trypanosoma vivax]